MGQAANGMGLRTEGTLSGMVEPLAEVADYCRSEVIAGDGKE